jgi:hypothetical protein
MRKLLFLMLMAFFTINISSQTKKPSKILSKSPNGYIRCYSTEYEKNLQKKNNRRAKTDGFENWISDKINRQKFFNNRISAIKTIPVVVHVINKGEAVGIGTNISDAQVISQITTLNNDYRKKTGTKGYNTNPVGADANIEFALAVRDPNGNPTNGIDRISFNVNSWTDTQIEAVLKPSTIWDPTKYLNIWVTPDVITDIGEVLGYAQFPEASTLDGLNYPPFTANTDGVVIGHQFFGNLDYDDGSFNLDPTYGYGRTTTHEIGHWLGLRHIWGDDTCGTDYVADTPVHKTENYGCFTHPKPNTCTPATADEMFENYMDYTSDTCMNIFTINQVDRFNAVLANSPRRKELLTSDALTPVTLYANDAELKFSNVNVEASTTCKKATANVRLINRGTSNLTTAIISINDAGTNYNQSWSGNLAPNKETLVSITLLGTSLSNNVTIGVSSVNGDVDARNTNNADSFSYEFLAAQNFPTSTVKLELQLDDYGSETSWEVVNSEGIVLYSGDSYEDIENPAVKKFTFNLPNNSCYTFKIYDTYGDGFCCDYGNGYYKLTTDSGVVMVNQNAFNKDKEIYPFILGTLSTQENNKLGVNIFPNPVNDVLNITKVSNNATFTIYNVAGQFISKGKVTNDKVNVATLAKGVYFIEISEKGATSKMKFIKK